jgi:hypothetical protein
MNQSEDVYKLSNIGHALGNAVLGYASNKSIVGCPGCPPLSRSPRTCRTHFEGAKEARETAACQSPIENWQLICHSLDVLRSRSKKSMIRCGLGAYKACQNSRRLIC